MCKAEAVTSVQPQPLTRLLMDGGPPSPGCPGTGPVGCCWPWCLEHSVGGDKSSAQS